MNSQEIVDQRNYKKILVLSVALTVVAHLALMPVSVREMVTSRFEPVPQEQEKSIRITLDRREPTQIVQNNYQDNSIEKVESDFLSERDQAYEKQTVARNTGVFQEAGKGVDRPNEEAQVAQTSAVEAKQGQEAKQDNPTREGLRFADLGVKMQDQEFQEMLQERSLAGHEASESAQSGRAQSNDFVEDIPLGDVSQLNTQEYKYYGFYHRIRQRLEQHWGASLQESAERMYRTGRRLPANAQRITSLTVTMDSDGNILDVRVRNASGIVELDEAAIESFNRAGPFPNPPQGMISNGRVQIEWGFVVKS